MKGENKIMSRKPLEEKGVHRAKMWEIAIF